MKVSAKQACGHGDRAGVTAPEKLDSAGQPSRGIGGREVIVAVRTGYARDPAGEDQKLAKGVLWTLVAYSWSDRQRAGDMGLVPARATGPNHTHAAHAGTIVRRGQGRQAPPPYSGQGE
jgi:hypothetical protein